MLELGFDEAQLEQIEIETQQTVDRATEEAKASPPSPVSLAFQDVWADGGIAWRN